MENVEFGLMRLNNVNRRCCAAACRRIPPIINREHSHRNTKRVRRGWAARNAIFSKPRICQSSTSCAAYCALAALSLCSHSFVCLMTSLRGLLALDIRSQNGRTFPRKSCIQKELHLRYMIGNFCHDSLVINIKIDTKDAAQKKKKNVCTFQLIRPVPAERRLLVGEPISPARISQVY